MWWSRSYLPFRDPLMPEPYPGDPYVHNTFKQYYSDHHPVVFRLAGTGVDDD